MPINGTGYNCDNFNNATLNMAWLYLVRWFVFVDVDDGRFLVPEPEYSWYLAHKTCYGNFYKT